MGDFLEEEYYTDELGEAIDVGLEFAEKSVIEFWWDRCRADGARSAGRADDQSINDQSPVGIAPSACGFSFESRFGIDVPFQFTGIGVETNDAGSNINMSVNDIRCASHPFVATCPFGPVGRFPFPCQIECDQVALIFFVHTGNINGSLACCDRRIT